MKRLVIGIILLSTPLLSIAADSISNSEMFKSIDSYAKTAGMCATYGQMSSFQQTAKVPNGDAFIGEFLVSEAERLKLPKDINVVDFCLKMAERYKQLSATYK